MRPGRWGPFTLRRSLYQRTGGGNYHYYNNNGLNRNTTSTIATLHLIAATTQRVQNNFALLPPQTSFVSSNARLSRRCYSTYKMASVDSVVDGLAKLSISPLASVKHTPATSPAEWKDALKVADGVPKEYQLTKTLVFKPKTAKSATPVPVVVIAREETETNSGALGKKLNLKELRLASPDLLTEFFQLDKDSCKPPLLRIYFKCPMN